MLELLADVGEYWGFTETELLTMPANRIAYWNQQAVRQIKSKPKPPPRRRRRRGRF